MPDTLNQIDTHWLITHTHLFIKKRVIIITGAGISVSSGIPDFRSKNGIFREIRKTLNIKGEDLFNYRYSRDDLTRPNYYKFISQLKKITDSAEPSITHNFLNTFKKYQKKYRVYTQNIDSLEEKAGMVVKEKNDTEVVYLHGDLKILICIFCGFKTKFTDSENVEFGNGKDIKCINCINRNIKRRENNVRQLKEGYLHTNIIHYNQPHHDGHRIASLFEKDMDVDLFIVMGTSLKVYGVKDFVKRALRCCMNNNGTSILVNLEDPAKEFQGMFNYFWKGKSDDFCRIVGENIEEYIEKIRMTRSTVKDSSNIISYTKIKSERNYEKEKDKNIEQDKKIKEEVARTNKKKEEKIKCRDKAVRKEKEDKIEKNRIKEEIVRKDNLNGKVKEKSINEKYESLGIKAKEKVKILEKTEIKEINNVLKVKEKISEKIGIKEIIVDFKQVKSVDISKDRINKDECAKTKESVCKNIRNEMSFKDIIKKDEKMDYRKKEEVVIKTKIDGIIEDNVVKSITKSKNNKVKQDLYAIVNVKKEIYKN